MLLMSTPSERWRAVDRSQDPDASVRFLERTSTRAGERHPALSLLRLEPGQRCLDVGCGLGEDARSIASATGALVVGVDLSVHLASVARSRTNGDRGPVFAAADGAHLPLAAGSFDAAWVKRVLMHLPDAGPVVHELRRVLRPGGRLVAVEPDSEILLLDSGLPDVTRRVLAFRAAGYANPWSGRQLPRHLREAGLVDISVEVHAGGVPGLAAAEQRLHLLGVARAAAAKGAVAEDERREWEADLVERDRRNVFTCFLLMVIADGRVPPERAPCRRAQRRG